MELMLHPLDIHGLAHGGVLDDQPKRLPKDSYKNSENFALIMWSTVSGTTKVLPILVRK